MKNNHYNIMKDLAIIAFSVVAAVLIVKTDALVRFFEISQQMRWLGSFVAGVFFTSIFTVAPAMVALGEIARAGNPLFVAFFGALGAVCGDFILFRFVRDRFSEHLMELFGNKRTGRKIKFFLKIKLLLRKGLIRWSLFLIGAFIIASPLPDEIGISMMGISKIKTRFFLLLSFIFNFIGILLVGLVAKSL